MVQTTAGVLYCGRQAESSVLYCRRRYGPVSSRLLQVCYIVEGVVVQSTTDYCRCVTLRKAMWSINSRLLQVCYIVCGGGGGAGGGGGYCPVNSRRQVTAGATTETAVLCAGSCCVPHALSG